NPSHTYAGPGTYLVCLTITDADGGCTSHFCHEVVAHHPAMGVCQAAFSFHQAHPDAPVDFTDESSSDLSIVSWQWEFGDGSMSTLQNPAHTYAGPGTYIVCLTIISADGACTSHFCHEVVVHHPAEPCHAAFIVHTESDNHSFHFTNTSGGTSNQSTYSWDFGDGTTSTEENPHHTYTHLGQYTVCLFLTDLSTGCSSHVCHTINVYHLTDHPHYARAGNVGERANSEAGPAVANPADNSVRLENYPNPFSDVTTIHYQLADASTVKIELYDLSGKKMIEIAERSQATGEHVESLRVGQLLPGNYLLKMTVNEKNYVRQVAVQ
ncbi:MAG: PKD domain-containing protein, partial [Saprospiraceae bacterium]